MVASSSDCWNRKVVRFFSKDTTMFDSIQYDSEDSEQIKEIKYHYPMGEGDKHYCDVYYTDGTIERLFEPNTITFSVVGGE